MRRLAAVAAVTAGLLAAGGASVYTLRASGASGCPDRVDLENPEIDFRQDPGLDYIWITLTNPNSCYGFQDEPVEITLYGANGRRAISYFGNGPPHGDVGVCCTVTLPPRGTWGVRLGGNLQWNGASRITVCNIHFEALNSTGLEVWKRMPEGGAVTGQGSFPPNFTPNPTPLPDDPTWLEPCESNAAAPSDP